MTENEAIEILKCDSCYECEEGADSPINCNYGACRVAEATRKAIKALEEVQQYRDLEKKGLLLRLPCKVGDTVYAICECENIPQQLDGTLYGENGEPGTATGYYCPYEDNCPHECEASDELFDCDKFKKKQTVFEDEVEAIWLGEDGVSVIATNCPINSHIGEFVFLTKAEAEEKLRELEKCHDGE